MSHAAVRQWKELRGFVSLIANCGISGITYIFLVTANSKYASQSANPEYCSLCYCCSWPRHPHRPARYNLFWTRLPRRILRHKHTQRLCAAPRQCYRSSELSETRGATDPILCFLHTFLDWLLQKSGCIGHLLRSIIIRKLRPAWSKSSVG